MNTNIKIVLLVLGIVGVGFASYMAWKNNPELGQVACTMEAKMCPDGLYVGRTGPMCEFEACPGTGGSNGDLKTEVSEENGLSFQYPETLGTTYMSATDWPPVLLLVNEAFACIETEGGVNMVTSERKTIDGRAYCMHSISEGAAGSIYTGYIYAFAYGDQTAAFTFSVQATQCGNYDEAKRAACESERETFNPDFMVDKMARSMRVVQ